MGCKTISQPHEDHYGHVLAMTERENAEDHHFEPVSARAGLIKAKHNRRKRRRLRRQRISRLMKGASNLSLDSSKTDKTARTEKSSEAADADVSDQEAEPFGEQIAISISDHSPLYSPAAVFSSEVPIEITEIGDIPFSSDVASDPVAYRPGPEGDTDVAMREFRPAHGQVVFQTSKETDV